MSKWAVILLLVQPAFADEPRLRLTAERDAVEAFGLGKAELDSAKDWSARLQVRVKRDRDQGLPAMLGTYTVKNGVVRFTPRVPFEPGLTYRAVLTGGQVSLEFTMPKLPSSVTTVEHVYPSGDRLPENLLKFYIHFSAPMRQGEAYAHIKLLDDAGKAVPAPFLELAEELWDREGKRFTLFFDPGRIKRGLVPHEELGLALAESKTYTLVIDRDWTDAAGNLLGDSFRKSFHVVAPESKRVDVGDWKIEAPKAGTSQPLVVRFPRALDHALLLRLLEVVDERGRPVSGAAKTADAEQTWQFSPTSPWRGGAYELVIDTTLEDLAGNSVAKPFEVDMVHQSREKQTLPSVTRSFIVSRSHQ
jgi:hypothetical protein